MRVNETNSTNNFSAPKAGVAGAALGYLATYAVPLTTDEHARYFTKAVKDGINNKVLDARRSEITSIFEELNNKGVRPLVKDVFQRNAAALESAPEEVIATLHNNKGIDKSAKKALSSLYKRVNNSGKITEITENMATSLAAKRHGRAALYYAFLGSLIFITAGLIKNGLDSMFPKKDAKAQNKADSYEMTDLDYIINCDEGSAQLYIHGFGAAAKNKPGK